MKNRYDVIIIGAGPAGLTAAMYCSRARLDTLIIEEETLGGELARRTLIENYPCIAGGIQGPDLAKAMAEQAFSFGAENMYARVEAIDCAGELKTVHTDEGDFTCRAVIVSCGSNPRKLNVPGEDQYDGMGVFYCETCDGPLFEGKDVIVAGAGDSGLTGALTLANYCTSVTVIEYMEKPKASRTLLERAWSDPKIRLICNMAIREVLGDGEEMTGIVTEDRATGRTGVLSAGGILVRIGQNPNTAFLKGVLPLTGNGQISVDGMMETGISGVFAAGDVREKSPMQISTAVGDGATAALSVGRYLNAH